MTKAEIKLAVLEAIELLQESKPGRGEASVRQAKRAMANQKLNALPASWWKKVGKDADMLTGALTDAAW